MMEIKNLFEIENFEEKILNFLKEIDNEFKIPLSKRVSLDEYMYKIKTLASSYVILDNNKIIASIIFYKNDNTNKKAYVTLVGVLREYQKRGIAKLLLEKCIFDTENSSMRIIGIHTDNIVAKKVYEEYGFKEVSEINGRYYLEKNLKEGK